LWIITAFSVVQSFYTTLVVPGMLLVLFYRLDLISNDEAIDSTLPFYFLPTSIYLFSAFVLQEGIPLNGVTMTGAGYLTKTHSVLKLITGHGRRKRYNIFK